MTTNLSLLRTTLRLLRSQACVLVDHNPAFASSTRGFLCSPRHRGIVAHEIQGLAFMSHQIGSFVGAYGGGLIYDQLGFYNMAWRIGSHSVSPAQSSRLRSR